MGETEVIIKDDLMEEKIKKAASEILPLSNIAAMLNMDTRAFYDELQVNAKLQNIIISAETKVFLKEYSNYEKICNNYILQQPLQVSGVKKTITVDERIALVAINKFNKFESRFQSWSLTCRLDKYDELRRTAGIKAQSLITDNHSIKLKEAIIKKLDKKTGVGDRSEGDLSFNENHLKAIKIND